MELAEDKAEILKTLSYDAVASTEHTSHRRYGRAFNRYFAASELNKYDEVYKVITISVTWRTSTGLEKDVKLFTVIAED